MHTCTFIERNATRYPDATATEEDGRTLSWQEFRDNVCRLAAGLSSAGVAPGDRIAILAENSAAYIELTYATQWLGAVSVPINTRWTSDEVAFALSDCGARFLFIDGPGADTCQNMDPQTRDSLRLFAIHSEQALSVTVESTLPDLRADEGAKQPLSATEGVASIFYTGGTTGRSKGVQLTHANHVLHSLAMAAELSLAHGTRHLHVAPMFHIADSLFIHTVTALGGAHVVVPRFEPQLCGQTLSAAAIDQTILVPTMIGMLMNEEVGRAGLRRLGRLFYGASPMPQAIMERLMAECPQLELVQLYGQTESGPVLTVLRPDDHLRTDRPVTRSAGRAMLGCEVRIVDPEDKVLPVGKHGEIAARGPQVSPGYLNRPEENASTFRGGWLHTGDAGFMDEEGYVYVTDRIKDMIITGGENVYSVEVEQVVYSLDGVDACCVVGVPHEKWGEAVHAIVVPKAGSDLDAATVLAHCAEHLANYKRPRGVTIRETPLPVSGAGKILKRVLREELRDSSQ